jgi:hypothetical protein
MILYVFCRLICNLCNQASDLGTFENTETNKTSDETTLKKQYVLHKECATGDFNPLRPIEDPHHDNQV